MEFIFGSIYDEENPLSKEFFGSFQATLFEFGGAKLSLASMLDLSIRVVFVFLVARSIKLFLKNRVLKRLGLDLGTRESLAGIIYYFVIVAGCLLVLQSVGIQLGSLAVFAGALGIGVGLGLQNLVANFISGITLLIERPVKVGDFVEVNDLKGTVEQIAIRSTIIRTNQGVAVIVPNSSFLDNSVVNWTYQDPRCCISIVVSVPSTDNSLEVTEALLAAGRKEARVLLSPPPKVYFCGIDEESLEFELRVWIDDPPEMDSIKSALYFLVEAEFQERGINEEENRVYVKISSVSALSNLMKQLRQAGVLHSEMNGLPSGEGNAVSLSEPIAVHPNRSRSAAKLPQQGTLRDLLRKVSYFENFSDIELRHIIEEGYRKTLTADEVICWENDPGDSFYIILSGSVEVFVESLGKRVATRTAGEFVGEMSLLMGTPRTATLRTLEETVLFVVDRANLQSLLQKHQELADRISEELAQRQDTLERLGIKVAVGSREETPFQQIRKHLQSIFGI